MLNDVQKHILEVVAAMKNGETDGAVNIRIDGKKAHRVNSEHIRIESKTDKDGIDIIVKPGVKGKSVHIPVLLTIPV